MSAKSPIYNCCNSNSENLWNSPCKWTMMFHLLSDIHDFLSSEIPETLVMHCYFTKQCCHCHKKGGKEKRTRKSC